MSDLGFNFRATAGPPPTDAASTTYVIGDIYPTVRAGVTFGWTSGAVVAFDAGGAEAREYGINYINIPSQSITFRVDLPAAGTYNFSLALGFLSSLLTNQQLIVKDNTTTLLTIGPATANVFLDATGTSYSSGLWLTSQTPVNLTFTTTTAFFVLSPYVSDNVALAHIFLSPVTATGGYLLVKN